MKRNDSVSIIICVFNGEKYIQQCLESVLNQTYKNIEVIVVDDGSQDGLYEVVKCYPDVKYYYQENRGIGAARALGVSHCNGRYITMLDVDDLYLPTKIEDQVGFLKKNSQYDIVYNDAILVDDNLNQIKIVESDFPQMCKEDFFAHLLFRQIVPCMASMLFKRECFGTVNYPENLRHAEDYWMTIKQAEAYHFGYLKKSLYKYRRHTQNLTNNHVLQEEAEIKVVQNLGIQKISEIVSRSTLNEQERILLLVKILIKIREYKCAIRVLEENNQLGCLELFYKGNAWYLLGEYCEAIKLYQEAIRYEERAEVYNNLAVALYHEGRGEVVEKYLLKAVDLNGFYLDAKHNLMQLNQGDNNYKITVRELRKCLMMY